jgi:hypothetical protein
MGFGKTKKQVLFGFKKNKYQTQVIVRSKWEKEFINFLETNDNVLHWTYDFPIKYFDKFIAKKQQTYFIDFFVKLKNKKVLLIEIKPLSFLKESVKTKSEKFKKIYRFNYLKNKSKFKQASQFAKSKGWNFYIVGKEKNNWKFIEVK